MALKFDIGTTDRLSAASSSSLDNLTAFTFWIWLQFNNDPPSGGRTIWSKSPGIKRLVHFGTGGGSRFRFEVDRSGSDNAAAETVDVTVQLDHWYLFAATWDESDGPRIFAAGLSSDIATSEFTYSGRIVGSRATSADAGAPFLIGSDGGSNSHGITVAMVGYESARFSPQQLRQLRRPANRGSTRLLYDLRHPVSHGSVPDFSASRNFGTPIGLVDAQHVPLTSLYGFDAPTVLSAGGASTRRGSAPLFFG